MKNIVIETYCKNRRRWLRESISMWLSRYIRFTAARPDRGPGRDALCSTRVDPDIENIIIIIILYVFIYGAEAGRWNNVPSKTKEKK